MNALMQGPEAHYATGEDDRQDDLGADPALASGHGGEMAMLEPGLSETVCATLLAA